MEEARLRTPVMTLKFSHQKGTSEVRKSNLDMTMGRDRESPISRKEVAASDAIE